MGKTLSRYDQDHSDFKKSALIEDAKGSAIIYPNPANDKLNVQLASSAESRTSVTVLDLNGNALIILLIGTGETYTQFNIANLATGVYFVKIISGNGTEISVKKFVKL